MTRTMYELKSYAYAKNWFTAAAYFPLISRHWNVLKNQILLKASFVLSFTQKHVFSGKIIAWSL